MSLRQKAAVEEVAGVDPVALKARRLRGHRVSRYRVSLLLAALPPVAVAAVVLTRRRPPDHRVRRYRVPLLEALPPVAVAADAATRASAPPRSRRSS